MREKYEFTNCSNVADAVSFDLGLHHHDLGQVTFIRRGLMQVETAQAGWVIPEGCFCWVPPGVLHAARCAGHASYWQLLVSAAYTAILPARLCALRATDLAEAAFERVLRAAASAGRSAEADNEGRMLHHVIRHELAAAVVEPFGITLPTTEPWRGLAARLRGDPSQRFTLDDVAALTNMSRRSVARHFRRETGMSFGQWRHVALGQKALELLGTGVAVSDTALMLGYESVSAFIHAFRKWFGTSPGRLIERSRPPADEIRRSLPPPAMS